MRGVCFFVFIVLLCGIVQANHCESVGDEFLVKMTLDENTSAEKIVNLAGEHDGTFQLGTNMKGVSFSESSVVFHVGQESVIEVIFNSSSLEPGVYVGKVTATNEKDTISIPIIFEVETHELFFDLNIEIPQVYTEVEPGMQFVADVSVFDLTSSNPEDGLGPTSVDIDYRVYNFDGQILHEQSEQSIVQHTQHTRHSFSMPKSLDCAEYVFAGIVRYRNMVRVSSSVFSVSEPAPRFTRLQIYFMIALAVLFALIVLIFLMMRHFHRSKRGTR